MTLFRQIHDAHDDAYAYLLADADTRDAVAIDVTDRDTSIALQALLSELDLRLRYLLETHAHAHSSKAVRTASRCTGARVVGSGWGPSVADVVVRDGDVLTFGNEVVHIIATPGHTPGCLTYVWRDRAFTGDCLWIGGCAPLDGEDSDAGALYDSVVRRLFTLPDQTLIFPARAGHGRTVSTIAEERLHHPCFARRSRDEFVTERRLHATACHDSSHPRGGESK